MLYYHFVISRIVRMYLENQIPCTQQIHNHQVPRRHRRRCKSAVVQTWRPRTGGCPGTVAYQAETQKERSNHYGKIYNECTGVIPTDGNQLTYGIRTGKRTGFSHTPHWHAYSDSRRRFPKLAQKQIRVRR